MIAVKSETYDENYTNKPICYNLNLNFNGGKTIVNCILMCIMCLGGGGVSSYDSFVSSKDVSVRQTKQYRCTFN